MKEYKHLHIPETWQHYWTKYPEGYTVMESLINWVSQSNLMIDDFNKLQRFIQEYEIKTEGKIDNIVDFIKKFIDEFESKFDNNIALEVSHVLNSWLDSGIIEEIIGDNVLPNKADNYYPNATTTLDIPTYYYDDDHTVHPSVEYYPDRKYGYEFIMLHTPYSEGRDRYENPSVAVSRDRYTWSTPTETPNPIIPQPEPGYHYSDPCQLDNGSELEMWYRMTNKSTGMSKLLMTKTTNLVDWSEPVTILDHTQLDTAYICPTLVIEEGLYKLWYRDVSAKYVMVTSNDLVEWSSPVEINYDFNEYEGQVSWHNEIKKIDGKYLSVNATTSGELFLFESQNGVDYTLIKRILKPSISGFDSYKIYKASVVKYGVWLYVYYSAYARDNSFHIGLTRANASSLNFSGMTEADKEFHLKRRVTRQNIYGHQDKDPVNIRTGAVIHGENGLSLLNTGVSELNVQTHKQGRLGIFTPGGRLSYLETAGLYINSLANDSIQGIHMDMGATYLDNTEGLTIHPKGTYKQRYSRLIHFTINLGNKTITSYEGEDLLGSIESVTHGVKIQFKNMPSAYVPFASLTPMTPEGIKKGDTLLNYMYLREIGPNYMIIGIKESPASTHTPLEEVTFGSVRVGVNF